MFKSQYRLFLAYSVQTELTGKSPLPDQRIFRLIGRTSLLKVSNRMFITDASAHHPFMSRLLGNGKDAWRAVGLTTPSEWFHVSYALATPKGSLTETVLIANPAGELIAFLDRESEGVSVLGIQLVTPPFLNGSGHWKMEALIRVWNKSSDPLAHVYEVEGGQRYCTAYGAWDISEYEFWKEFTSVS